MSALSGRGSALRVARIAGPPASGACGTAFSAQSGKVFRLKNKGVPNVNGYGRGDQFITVKIETPQKLNKKQKELLKQFDDAMGKGHHQAGEKFWDKVKNAFQ